MGIDQRAPRGFSSASLTRLYRSLDQMSEALEVLNAELVVAAVRRETPLSPWTHERLSAIAAALDDLRGAVDTSPRDTG